MASTTQSAVEYVRGARIHLVKTLKNHSVILENLKQQGVLRDEEVCRIQAEGNDYDKNRKLIDSVTDKGEKASYEFLKIIDMTRKRTHGRTSLFPEKQTVASAESKMFDLHHWISCFPFKEDTQMGKNYLQGPTPCHRYQAKLKSKAQKISKAFWTANKDLFEGNNKPDLSYMPLVLDTQGRVSASKIKKLKSKKSRMSRSKKLGTYIPKDKADISPSDLLKTDKNILLVGKSGIGKTALVHEMLKLWTEKDDKELNYMFYFDMRKISNIKSLEDLLFNEFSEPDEGKDEVLQDIKNNSDKVTLIFDGITDLSSPVVKRLVDKDLLKDSMVVLTCRPVDEDNLEEDLPSEDFDRVEVKGFSEQTIKTYISAMLREGKERVLSNVELLTLCHVPMYALMVTACFSFETSEDFQKPCCITDIYINIFRFCLKRNTKNIDLNAFIKSKSEEILSLAEVAFRATEEKTVNLTLPPFADSCVLSLLKQLAIKVAPTESITTYAFLHYTMQEFFAALWLLKNPDLISNVFQQCLTEKKKHMKHLIPYMCRLLTEDSPSLMKYLIPVEELKNTSNWFFKKVISTFLPSLCENDEPDTEDSGRILFLCQCLYESQCPEACIDLLEKLDYRLDLSGESLDPYPCCAVAYVITQSKEKKIWLNLEDVTISQQGMRPLLGCLQNVQWCDSLPRQLWKIFLLSEGEMDYITLLGLDGNQLHLPVGGDRKLFERAVTVLQKISEKVNICLHWERETPDCHSLCETLLEALPYVSSLSFRMTLRGPGLQDQERCYETLKRQEKQLFLDLCLKAATHFQGESVHNEVNNLIFLFSFNYDMHNILLDLYQHVKTQENLAVIQKLKPFFQSVPAFWFINLSKRKTSILLEVLRLQPEKKQVELRRCSDKESEVRTLLQCLPYISKLSFVPQSSEPSGELQFFGTLFCAAAEREQQTGEKTLLLLLSVCTYQTITLTDIVSYYLKRNPQCDFLLDLYSHLKDYETETGLSVLPSLKSVLQSAPAVWIIALSKRKSSILLEVLRLQPEKKQVELRGCSEEESEVRILLQCLPYISKLSYCPWFGVSGGVQFFGTLFCAAAEREQQTGEKTLELLSSVCTYPTFPLPHIYDPDDGEYQSGFLLDLYSHLKDYETESGLSVLPSLQSVLQSAPAVWTIDLSERKTSILLEVLRLQPEKKQVELTGCSGGESEVRTLLQCLPYISQLSFVPQSSEPSGELQFFGTLFCAAAEREQQTGEKKLLLLLSVCTYQTITLTDIVSYYFKRNPQCDFLLDLASHLKDYETETGLSVLPLFQSVLQSAPEVWTINLSQRKTSILLEVLRLQPEKKQVKLRGCSYGESEVRTLLQCLPYISKLSFVPQSSEPSGELQFFGTLFCAAAEREQQTGEKTLLLLLSVCTYQTITLTDIVSYYLKRNPQGDFLLDLYSHLKDYETETGLSVLPSLQSVLQSAPAVWTINLSKRKTSILLEVLRLQPEKKQVELRGCSGGESEVRTLLQCLPYISKLSSWFDDSGELSGGVKFFGTLFCAAAEREQQTGEKTLELLSSVCTYPRFPLPGNQGYGEYKCGFLLDLYSHLKDCETETCLSVLPSLQSVLQSAPAVWIIDLSKRKSSILLEVLRLQPEKKQVRLTGCSGGESEVRTLLQCLPYISKLSFKYGVSGGVKFFGTLFCAAAEREQQTGEKTLELLSSVCTYPSFPFTDTQGYEECQCDFLLDLYSHLKDYETETGLSFLPSLQSVLQSAPVVWIIDLSERKTSLLLEVLRLQPEKKQVKLTGCSDGESEVRTLLQCLPYISKLSFVPQSSEPSGELQFFGTLFCAAGRAQQTGEKTLLLLLSVCTYQTITLTDIVSYYFKRNPQCDFLLDLYSHLKDYETETGLSVLPSLKSVLQSAPAVWFIDLSERKTSILLEVLRLQPEKKQVELTGCSDEESEVRTLLQCLPYISKLSYCPWIGVSGGVQFFGTLFCAAAEREQQTGEKTLELLSSVCTHPSFPLPDKQGYEEYQSGFLLDLYSHLKDYETESGLSVLPSLQSVLQSAPAVWFIDLSERKTSILLEVLRLQPEKKQVELTGCSGGESEVRTLLQCLPYISQLSFVPQSSEPSGELQFFGTLFCAAAEREQQTGEKKLLLLLSVCTYQTITLTDIVSYYFKRNPQCDFLLDLASHLKDYETETGLSVLPLFQSVLQSAPEVWTINLSQRKTSILLEVLRLQPEKKQVKLRGCSDGESEVRTLLQCLPDISKLSSWFRDSGGVKFFGTLFCAAAEREQQTGEKTLELLSSVCTYPRFPLTDKQGDDDDDEFDYEEYQSDFLLDLYSHLKDYETETGLSFLPSLQSVLQSAPAVWIIDLSQRKSSILLEVLRLQPEKKQVELTGCSDGESEVRTLLQCLPYISQISCDPEFFQRVSTFISVRSREEAERLASLLQLSGFTLLLSGELPRKTCLSVGRVLQLCGSKVDLILKPRKMSVKGAFALFRRTTQLHSLKLSNDMALLLGGWVRRWGVVCQVTVEELSLSPQTAQPSHRVLLKVVSSLASLLRYWAVRQLDLTEVCVPALGLTPLLLHDGPLKIKLSEKNVQQLLSLLHELQDEDLTWSFLSKLGGDLTSFSLNWELLHLLLQHPSAQTLTVNMRKNLFLQENVTRLLPYLDRIVFKRPCPSFVLTAIREIYKARASSIIPSLLRSLDHVINLTCREMSSVDCDALLYTLTHSDGVKLNLLWTSIPAWKTQSILLNLDKVSQLSVDRNLLLRMVHGCAASDAQQGAAESLLRTVQHRLDLSCSSCVELPEEDQSDTLRLTAEDCRAVSTILTRSRRGTQLILQDCEVQDSGLELLFPVLHKVKLRASKAVLLQLVSLVAVNSERDTVGRAVSLCKALEGELDLSHSSLDQRACAALALMLDFSEELTELDLSHCQLTDQLLLTLSAQLHKVQVLDLSHNNITDASTDLLLQLVSINPSIHSVRLFENNIVERTSFEKDKKFEIW
ncbi:uncharacterized protein LOC117499055 isoform X8 [Trematomus bernacchii]|uniref:uncharacterized protein LOC117499055 isoform X8 n=1 Tax=Trematomus bernacchii TaxID=40690 RepID=UPI00146D127A|nr:uncharacterized protein LOC117499055 isoform X8 [Trematomus bernacchii]